MSRKNPPKSDIDNVASGGEKAPAATPPGNSAQDAAIKELQEGQAALAATLAGLTDALKGIAASQSAPTPAPQSGSAPITPADRYASSKPANPTQVVMKQGISGVTPNRGVPYWAEAGDVFETSAASAERLQAKGAARRLTGQDKEDLKADKLKLVRDYDV